MSLDPEEIKRLVREVVTRTLGESTIAPPRHTSSRSHPSQRPLLDAETVRQLPAGSVYEISADTLVTPLARQAALERRIRLSVCGNRSSVSGHQSPITDYRPPNTDNRTIAIGADHGGYALKEQLKDLLETGYTVIDCGTHSVDSVDYPDFAYAVARLVADGRAWRGIIIDGAGIGSCMAANKVPGVRAAMCYDQATAVNSREHNNANVLTLGAGLIGPSLARQIVTAWLNTEFGGGRHARRVDKIDAIGKRYLLKQ
ncbi:MAG TPA: ribose 5-phosphate isomerase B [Chloroflexi bacterium]|nr:ribose 5-phosphate isomerase B [Chloroflexota bacterium]